MKLKRLNNKKYQFYRVYDATNNEVSDICLTFRDAKKLAYEWLQGQGCTVEIVGYKYLTSYTVAYCEDF